MSHRVRRPPRRHGRAFHVESQHPECGWLTRGWIHPDGLAGGCLLWRLTDYDHSDTGQIAGDYVSAEKALLEATRGLED